eukprot:tig00020563_g11204.t1
MESSRDNGSATGSSSSAPQARRETTASQAAGQERVAESESSGAPAPNAASSEGRSPGTPRRRARGRRRARDESDGETSSEEQQRPRRRQRRSSPQSMEIPRRLLEDLRNFVSTEAATITMPGMSPQQLQVFQRDVERIAFVVMGVMMTGALQEREAERQRQAEETARGARVAMAQLPLFEVGGPLAGENASCHVCLDEFSAGQTAAALPCIHIYHEKCIEGWFSRSLTCPMCRADVLALLQENGVGGGEKDKAAGQSAGGPSKAAPGESAPSSSSSSSAPPQSSSSSSPSGAGRPDQARPRPRPDGRCVIS